MFRYILLAVLFPLLLLTGLSVQAVQSDAQSVTVTVRYLNVRQAPNTSSKVLVVVRAGQTYPVLGQSGTWWQIQVGDITGYVSGRYVKINSSSTTLTPAPIVTVPDETTCSKMLFFSNSPLDICVGAAVKTQAAFQTYEHGFMIWLADSGDIWVFINAGSRSPWLHFRQSDYAGFSDNTLSAPSGLVQPINGFGRVWGHVRGVSQTYLKNELGWATASEVSYTATWQFYGAASVMNTYITMPDGRIADAYNGMAGIFWSFVQQ